MMPKMLYCGLKVNVFELQSRYYIQFQSYTLGKGMNPLFISPPLSWIVSLLFFNKDSFGIR